MPLRIGYVQGDALAQRILSGVLEVRYRRDLQGQSGVAVAVVENFQKIIRGEPVQNPLGPGIGNPILNRARPAFIRDLGLTQWSIINPATGYVVKQIPPMQRINFMRSFRQTLIENSVALDLLA